MNKEIMIDPEIKAMFDLLAEDASTMEVCMDKIKRALSVVAESFHLNKVELKLEAPGSKLCPQGQHAVEVLYDRGNTSDSEPVVSVFPLPSGGTVTVVDYSYGQTPFSSKELELHNMLFRKIFYKISRTMMQNLLQQAMMMDMSTGVANQDYLMHFVGGLIASGRIANYNIIFFNVHNFKYVNKVFSYEQGDVILHNYAQHIKNIMGNDEIVARLGGDNFVLVFHKERRETLIEQLQNIRIYHQWQTKEREFVFGATIGVSNLDGITVPRAIMGRASIAYQAARQKGVGSVVEFSPEIEQEILANQSIVSNFLPALHAKEFVIYYQPKVNIAALVRWIRNGKMVPPIQFIPQLEREGSVCKLDYYVLENVCAFLKDRLDKGLSVVPISVNYSRRHLEEENLVKRTLEIIDHYGVDHHLIEIELTESDDFQNYEIMSGIIDEFKANGIGTSIDDFGTGFSSLNMIKEVDLETIKIDKSFIPLETDYPGKERDLVMFHSIVQLINELGKKSIAEGVETVEQLDYLKEVGCDIVQGYVFDKPLPQEMFEERLASAHPYENV